MGCISENRADQVREASGTGAGERQPVDNGTGQSRTNTEDANPSVEGHVFGGNRSSSATIGLPQLRSQPCIVAPIRIEVALGVEDDGAPVEHR